MEHTSNQELTTVRSFCCRIAGTQLASILVCVLIGVISPDGFWPGLVLFLLFFLCILLNDMTTTRLEGYLERRMTRFLYILIPVICCLSLYAVMYFSGSLDALRMLALLVGLWTCNPLVDVLQVLRKLSRLENG